MAINVEAVRVQEVQSSNITTDGHFAMIRLATQGGPMTLALPVKAAPTLMQLLSTAVGESSRLLQQDPNLKHVVPAERWEIGRSGDKVVLSFRVPGGAEQSFWVNADQLVPMRDALAALAGSAPEAGKKKK